MRMFSVFAVAVAVLAIGFGFKAIFAPRPSVAPESVNGSVATSNTLSPHEIHLNYGSMKELPVHEVKDAF